jgi:hypothetical protein
MRSTPLPSNMKTTPLPPLTWDTPAFRNLFTSYWDIHRSTFYEFSDATHEYNGPYRDFYNQGGYTNATVPTEEEMLDNDIHPIFAKSNWITDFSDDLQSCQQSILLDRIASLDYNFAIQSSQAALIENCKQSKQQSED